MFVIADIEADGLDPTKIHCMWCKEYTSGKWHTFYNKEDYHAYTRHKKIVWVFHNGLQYDVPVLNRLWDANIDSKKVIDTHVVSRTIDYTAFSTHSLKEIGEKLGVYKGDYTGGWENWNEEMDEYCKQDVEVTAAIFKNFYKEITNLSWKKSLRVEHDMAIICEDMNSNGFHFNKKKAEEYLLKILKEKKELEDSFHVSFPPSLVEKTRLQIKRTKDGKLHKRIKDAYEKYPKVEVDGEELVCYVYEPFDPASPKKRIDALWESGWKPVDKTKGHIDHEKSGRYSA